MTGWDWAAVATWSWAGLYVAYLGIDYLRYRAALNRLALELSIQHPMNTTMPTVAELGTPEWIEPGASP